MDKDDVAGAIKNCIPFQEKGQVRKKCLENISQAVKMLTKKYKTRFVIKVGEHLKSIEITDILFCFSLEKVTFAKLIDGRKHILILPSTNWKRCWILSNFFALIGNTLLRLTRFRIW